MLRSTCSLLTRFLDLAPGDVPLSKLLTIRDEFRSYLESCHYRSNSVRSYLHYLQLLITHAEREGWRPRQYLMPEWSQLADTPLGLEAVGLIGFLSHERISPSVVTEDDVARWRKKVVESGRTLAFASRNRRAIWKLLKQQGFHTNLPLYQVRVQRYGTALKALPETLRVELDELLRWKQALYALDRPKEARHRPVTAKTLSIVIRGIHGFATNIAGFATFPTLGSLINRSVIESFVEWKLNEQHVKPQSIHHDLRLLSAALRQYPKTKDIDIGWLQQLLEGLPIEDPSFLQERKARSYVDYQKLELVPDRIRALRLSSTCLTDHQRAQFAMQELLLRWMTLMPWRQRNLRQCRIGGRAPNLFKASVNPLSTVDKPDWVSQAEAEDATATFWQFRFTKEETKTKNSVHAIVPRQIVPLLEEYLTVFRPVLLGDRSDPGTLFMSERCTAFIKETFTKLVAGVTWRYAGTRVTPHRFRDIVAYAWLRDHPEDFLTLSKLLWHANVEITIGIYGSRFNESSGVRAMEAWADERQAARSQPTSRAAQQRSSL